MRIFFLFTIMLAVLVGWTAGGTSPPPALPASATPPAEAPRERTIAGTVAIDRGWEGHFIADGSVNGSTLRFVVDTGATRVALGRADAERAGVRVADGDFTSEARTASGTVRIAPVRLPRVRVGAIQLLDVPAFVLDVPDAMPLLGQSFLGRIDRVAIERDRLTLTKL